MSAQWVDTYGLGADIIGICLLSWGLFVTKQEALGLGQIRLSGDSEEENLKLPAVAALLRQTRLAQFGLLDRGRRLFPPDRGNLDRVGVR